MAFGDDSMDSTQDLKCVAVLKKGGTSVESDANFEAIQKVLFRVFFDQDGVVHRQLTPEGHTVNKGYYLHVLLRLRDAVRRKRAEKWSSGNWQNQHDDAPAHTAQLVQHFLAKHEIPNVQQPAYSLDLAQCDFVFILKI
jgi:hypothetical protein